MSWLASLRPGEFIWIGARILAVQVPISASHASELLPEALQPADPPAATLFIADYPATAFGSVYREAAVLLHARHETGSVLHCPWMVVDDDAALILGRELLGFPKKLAEIALEERDGWAVGRVTRKGAEVMRIEAELGGQEAKPASFFAVRMMNAIGTPLTGVKLVELPPAEERIHSARSARSKVTLHSTERDRLGELCAAPSAPARYLKLDFGSVAALGPRLLGDVDTAWVARRFEARAL